MSAILLHVTACLWYVFFWNNYLADNDILHAEWDPEYKKIHELGYRYLTNWNLFMQTIFFAGCLLHDIMKMLNGPNWLDLGAKFQNCLSLHFSSILLPTSLFVCFAFWTMYAYDREVVYPVIIDTYMPFWLNHGMHTTILPLILGELITTRHKFPSVLASLGIYLAFVIFYGLVFLETYLEKGRWVYPLFGMFSLPISIGIIIALVVKQIIFLFVGFAIQKIYWGKEEKLKYRKPAVKKSN